MSCMRGLTFKGLHCYDDFGLYMRSEDRALLPALRKKEIIIPGRHGVYDFDDNTYDKRIISVKFMHVEQGLTALRLKARKIAAWLSGKGLLIFDDEPDKYYIAKVYSNVSITDIATSAEFTIQFECQPFACYFIDTSQDFMLDSDILLDSDIRLDDVFSFQVTGNTVVEINNFGTQEINYKSQQGSVWSIIITGSFSNISISMNGKTFTYNEPIINQVVEIDNVKCLVKTSGINKLSVTNAEFLSILPGINDVTITGAGLNCEVLFKYNPLFL